MVTYPIGTISEQLACRRNIGPYVGADITSGILVTQLERRPGVVLFVDIGTNGEIVLSDNGRLLAASTAAGPAFEGMNIRHGMRAGPAR